MSCKKRQEAHVLHVYCLCRETAGGTTDATRDELKQTNKGWLMPNENLRKEIKQRMTNSKNKPQPPHLLFLFLYSVHHFIHLLKERPFFLHDPFFFSSWLFKVIISNYKIVSAQGTWIQISPRMSGGER